MKRCEDCVFCHPERRRECSVFGRRHNEDGNCAAYIEGCGVTGDGHDRRRQGRGDAEKEETEK